MIKREMFYRNTCSNCDYSWISEMGEETAKTCPRCDGDEKIKKWGEEESTEDVLKQLDDIESLINLVKKIKKEK